MLVAALLVGVVLAVVSVPVAVVVSPMASPARGLSPKATRWGAVEHADHFESFSRYDSIGTRLWATYAMPQPIAPGFRDALGPLLDAPSDPRPAFASVPYQSREHYVYHVSNGWPWPAAAGRWVEAPGARRPPVYESLVSVVRGQSHYRFPLRPTWPGLLANTLFYTALALAPMVLLRWRRTRRRRARGLCVACGYELGEGVGVCPECGLGRDRDSAAGNRQSAKT
ncbi:MAG: hypothetical protein RIB58_05845 [Phycisphaerales bacterium]